MSSPVLWMSNAPWTSTGYGCQTALVTRSLRDAGVDVAIGANYGLGGSKLEWEGITVYPNGYDTWSNDVVKGHAMHHFAGRRGWVVTLFDVFVAMGPAWRELEVASWVPVDHLPTPPKVLKFFTDTFAQPIAMSRFGERQLSNAGLDPWYAPHGVDTKVFHPQAGEVDGLNARQMLEIPDDAFVITMAAANKGNAPIRKGFPYAFAAFGLHLKSHPDSYLVMHTEKYGMADGVKLPRLAEACGIPADRIIFTDQYAMRVGMSDRILAAIYCASDVLLSPSLGEGFGIPVVEAQACGVPVIVSDFSAQSELCGSGWAVGGQPYWDEAQAAWFHLPSIGEIAEALHQAHDGQGDRAKARTFAEGYDHHRVFDTYWRPILAKMDAAHILPDVSAEPIDMAALT